jgi:hypothetical protein
MGGLLQAAAVVFLVVIWGATGLVIEAGASIPGYAATGNAAALVFVFAAALASIPGIALFAFGQLVNDARAMRYHLEDMVNMLRPHAH